MQAAVDQDTRGIRVRIAGAVQGVGFRPWVRNLATARSLSGRVWNEADTVRIEAFGSAPGLESFLDALGKPPLAAACIRTMDWEPIAAPSDDSRDDRNDRNDHDDHDDRAVAGSPRKALRRKAGAPAAPLEGFDIVTSLSGEERHPAIPADLAVCDDCREELHRQGERRRGYAFTNCTQCGPRYTISRAAPWDRERTTMRSFPLCEDCRREYEDPTDRRYHAEALACPVCGPRLELIDHGGARVAGSDPVAAAAQLLRDGAIVAVKGVGGYQLACDATSETAVALLRERKRRNAKPFAVMVVDAAAAEAVADLDANERELLASPQRPIVLVRRRPMSGLAHAVAPDNPLVGLFLPCTPLHELLLEAAGRPLVMTSGNLAEEPMAIDDAAARRRLLPAVADAMLRHDREIANRADDSIARVIDGAPVLLRRGRGHVPASFTLAHPTPRPLLACGGHLKNSFALAEGASLWPGPHVGDLETFEAENDYERMVERFSAFTDVRPEAFVHDLHPSYFTTAWAERRRAATRIGVQHHHAHLAATLVEHGISSPVLGLAWDGTGFGTDGTAWGGELLLADLVSFRRMATLRPIALAGGDLAIREVWRIALAVLDDAFGEGDQGAAPIEALPLFAAVDPAAVALVRRMTARGISCPRARGVGRAFDAAAAIVLAATASRFEGDAANRLAFIADPAEERSYDFALTPDAAGGPAEIDLRPAWRALALETLAGTPAHTVAARFQNTLTACAVAAVEHAEAEVGRLPVALSGGCFQNPALVGGIRSALGPGRNVLLHGAVPPNDGGLAVGQAAVGAAVLAGAAGRLGADAERPTVREGN